MKFTAATGTTIIRAMAAGATHAAAAAAGGVTDRTLRRWLRVGESDPKREPLGTFVAAFRRAESAARFKIADEAVRAMNGALDAA